MTTPRSRPPAHRAAIRRHALGRSTSTGLTGLGTPVVRTAATSPTACTGRSPTAGTTSTANTSLGTPNVRSAPTGLAALASLALLGVLATAAAPASAVPPEGAAADTPGTSSSVSPTTLGPGETISFTVTGYPAGEVLSIKIDDGLSCSASAVHGACVQHQQVIGKNGSVAGSFRLPEDIAPGTHWLRFLASEEILDDAGQVIGVNGYTRRGGADFTVVEAARAPTSPATTPSGGTGSTAGRSTEALPAAPAAGAGAAPAQVPGTADPTSPISPATTASTSTRSARTKTPGTAPARGSAQATAGGSVTAAAGAGAGAGGTLEPAGEGTATEATATANPTDEAAETDNILTIPAEAYAAVAVPRLGEAPSSDKPAAVAAAGSAASPPAAATWAEGVPVPGAIGLAVLAGAALATVLTPPRRRCPAPRSTPTPR
jgi:hypothetical protein